MQLKHSYGITQCTNSENQIIVAYCLLYEVVGRDLKC